MTEFNIEEADEQIAQSLESEDIVEEEIEDLDSEETETVDTEEEAPTPDITTDDGRDKAFADIRRERDQLAGDAEFIRKFAEANGMTVAELKAQHEEARLAKEADEQGVPVEVMKRLSTLETENKTVKEQAQQTAFNAQVDATMAKYSATSEDFNATIQHARDNGFLGALQAGAITFEAAYKLANMDTMIEDAKKNAVQSDLATRKKRQQEAPVILGSQSQADMGEDLDTLINSDVKDILANGNF